MSTSTAVIGNRPKIKQSPAIQTRQGSLDIGILLGIAIAALALIVGIAVTGVSAHYYFQPTGILIVVGGTIGVMLITTPPAALLRALRRTANLVFKETSPNSEKLIEEVVLYAKIVRIEGMLAIEPRIDQVSHPFLKDALLLAMDAKERVDLQSALENKIRLAERQSDAAAKVLEVAGGFAPTIGVLGTIVGLIDVLRQFSSLSAIASGVGAAFTSTIYGLALANLILLPAAHRIRARAAETFDLQELMTDGALCLFDSMHPRLLRQRLQSFLDRLPGRENSIHAVDPALEISQI